MKYVQFILRHTNTRKYWKYLGTYKDPATEEEFEEYIKANIPFEEVAMEDDADENPIKEFYKRFKFGPVDTAGVVSFRTPW